MRVSRISSAGTTASVAAITSAREGVSDRSDPMTKAISASTRGWMKRPFGTSDPSSKTMSSKSTPLSGVSIFSASCIARDVSPIFQPILCRPAASLAATSPDWMA